MSGFQPHVVAKVRLLSTEEGGRESVTPADQIGCLFEYEGEAFDCYLLLTEIGPVAPGEEKIIPIAFLSPELLVSRLAPGARFVLKDYRTIGEGTVESLT